MSNTFSIITIVKDDAAGLTRTLQSIFSQTYTKIQSIVVDGASSDHVDHVIGYFPDVATFISEQDSGIYQAMNKGISYVTGDWTLFLNAGDEFIDGQVLQEVNDFILIQDNAGIVCGATQEIVREHAITLNTHSISDMPLYMPACHQSIVMNSDLLKQYKFDDRFRICGDLDQMARVLGAAQSHILFYPSIIACINGDGLSNQLWKIAMQERKKIQKKYYSTVKHTWNLFWYHKRVQFKKFVRVLLPIQIVLKLRKILHREKYKNIKTR